MWRRRRQKDAALLALSASDPARYGAELIERIFRPPTSLLEGLGLVVTFGTGCSAIYVLLMLVLTLAAALFFRDTEWLGWITGWFFGLCGATVVGGAIVRVASGRTAANTRPLLDRLEVLSRESPEHLVDSLPVLEAVVNWSRDEVIARRFDRIANSVRAVAPPANPRELPLPAHPISPDPAQLPRPVLQRLNDGATTGH
jgi:hypothetical protein